MSNLFDILLQRETTLTNKPTDGDNALAALVTLIVDGDTEVLASAPMLPEQIRELGVGMPGNVDHSSRMLLLSLDWGWRPTPFIARHKQQAQFPDCPVQMQELIQRRLTRRWDKWCRAPPCSEQESLYSTHLQRVE